MKYWRHLTSLTLLILTIFVWSRVTRAEVGALKVAFLDVGQGDAIYIEAPNGNQVLVDAGTGRQVLRALGQVMPLGDHSIDLLIATHPDADHIGGFPEVLKRYQVGAVMESGVRSDTGVDRAFSEAVVAEGSMRVAARRGERVALGRGAYLEILFPDSDVTNWETNTASIVARLVYGENEFLLTGDSPIKIEKYLLGLDGQGLQSDVLKAGHHGSKTSTSPEYVAAVQPSYAIISAGKDNRYGHPHESVINILNQAGVEILETSKEGTITFESDGINLARL